MSNNTNNKNTKPKPVLSWGFLDEDEDIDYEGEWDRLCDELTTILRKINKGSEWHCTVANFGWQKLNGYKNFTASTGDAVLRMILPETQNSFRIYVKGKTIKINNFHHDSPVGDEWYTLTAA
jgi:hypothetical protein